MKSSNFTDFEDFIPQISMILRIPFLKIHFRLTLTPGFIKLNQVPMLQKDGHESRQKNYIALLAQILCIYKIVPEDSIGILGLESIQ